MLLPKAIDGTDEKILSPDNNLWNVLETISSGQPGFKRFVSINNNDKKQIDMTSLMGAYTQYKNSLKHE